MGKNGHDSKYCAGICLKGLSKTIIKLYSRSSEFLSYNWITMLNSSVDFQVLSLNDMNSEENVQHNKY